jgi:hypothetical protein
MSRRLLENGSGRLLEGTVGNRLLESSIPALYLPYEFTSVLISTGNIDPFFIDADQTTRILTGNVNPFGIDPDQTTVASS